MADHAADDGAPESTTDPQPQPVTDEAQIAARILAVIGTLLTLGQALGWVSGDQAASLNSALAALSTAILTLAAIIVPIWRARRARDVVTPLASPRSADGERLIALSSVALIRDAAAANVPLPAGTPEPTPWDEDDSVIRPVTA